ncbi:zinc-binding dehydrogenase [Streptomyces sp. NPDC018352]|uniref:zinc-binding dehydrogenase n=1 Tax=Streptomyces sp. NPDC018352 TaxID=3157194 RepID=UPI0033D61CEE
MLTGRGREHHGEILREVAALADCGSLKPVLEPRHFTLDTVIDAHTAVETGTNTGRVLGIEACLPRPCRTGCIGLSC